MTAANPIALAKGGSAQTFRRVTDSVIGHRKRLRRKTLLLAKVKTGAQDAPRGVYSASFSQL
ncbi:hypothetical protein KCP69_09485 [Salmonella enterica subsp. enterica]|nr:hypothetical protein KCP69_09485 [Salmonella enterica subsp. enterica]